MVWVKTIFIYIILVYLWTGVFKLLQICLNNFKGWLLNRSREKQVKSIMQNNSQMLVRSIKLEMFLEDKLNKITPYFPIRMEKSYYSNEVLMYEIRKDHKILFFYLKKLLPFKLSNLIFIYLIITVYLEFDILNYLQNIKLGELVIVINHISLLPSLLALTLIIISLFFISRNGIFKKAKSKVRVEEVENKIKFHKYNRVLLNALLFEGYENIKLILIKRDSLIKEVDKTQNVSTLKFDWLDSLEEIKELDKFVDESEKTNRDLFPFAIGIYHISFWKLFDLYSSNLNLERYNNRINKLNAIFITEEYMENLVKQRCTPDNFEKALNNTILYSVKMIIYIEKYIEIINRKINKTHYVYSFLAFITNKDK